MSKTQANAPTQTMKPYAPSVPPTQNTAPRPRGAPSTKTPAELAAQRQAKTEADVRNLQLSVDRACGFINGAGGSVGKRLGLYKHLPLEVREAAVNAIEERAATLRLLLGVKTEQRTTPSLAAILIENRTPKAVVTVPTNPTSVPTSGQTKA